MTYGQKRQLGHFIVYKGPKLYTIRQVALCGSENCTC